MQNYSLYFLQQTITVFLSAEQRRAARATPAISILARSRIYMLPVSVRASLLALTRTFCHVREEQVQFLPCEMVTYSVR